MIRDAAGKPFPPLPDPVRPSAPTLSAEQRKAIVSLLTPGEQSACLDLALTRIRRPRTMARARAPAAGLGHRKRRDRDSAALIRSNERCRAPARLLLTPPADLLRQHRVDERIIGQGLRQTARAAWWVGALHQAPRLPRCRDPPSARIRQSPPPRSPGSMTGIRATIRRKRSAWLS